MAQKKTKLHRSFGTQAPADRLFDIFNYLVLGLVAVCVLYPLYFIVIASVSDPVAINNGQVALWPVGFNTTGYEKIFENTKIWRSYSNTIFYTGGNHHQRDSYHDAGISVKQKELFCQEAAHAVRHVYHVLSGGTDSYLLMDERPSSVQYAVGYGSASGYQRV